MRNWIRLATIVCLQPDTTVSSRLEQPNNPCEEFTGLQDNHVEPWIDCYFNESKGI